VIDVERELAGSYPSINYIRRVLGVDGERMAPGDSINSRYMSMAVQRVAAYKVLDLFDWVSQGGPTRVWTEMNFSTQRYLHDIPTLDVLVRRITTLAHSFSDKQGRGPSHWRISFS
jgi:hypothetical protein